MHAINVPSGRGSTTGRYGPSTKVWVLLLVRHGPRASWRVLTNHRVNRPVRFGFSRVALGYHPGPDVRVVLTRPASSGPIRWSSVPVAPGPSCARSSRPAPVDPRLAAAVALEEEHGPRSPEGFTNDPLTDVVWVHLTGLSLHVSHDGRLSFLARSRPSEETPLFEVVDVVLPLFLAATAVASGA